MTDNVEGTILPQYRCNKIVGALQIKAIHHTLTVRRSLNR